MMKDSLRAALMWWVGELASMVPRRLRRLSTAPRETVAIQLWPDHVIVNRRGQKKDRENGLRVDIVESEPSAQRGAVSRAVSQMRAGGTPITVLLPEDQVLRKTVSLPAAAAENLREVLGYEMDRYTPFERDEVLYDFKLVGTDREKALINVDLAVVPRRIVDQASERIDGWGLSPTSIGVARDWRDPGQDFRFVSSASARSGRRLGTYLSYALVLAALGLGIAVGSVSVERLRDEAERQGKMLERLKTAAGEASRLGAKLEALSRERQFGLTKKTERLPAVLVLDQLSRLLTDDIWLYQFQMTGNAAQIHGYSPDASKIVALIEKSPYFRQAVFRSRVTRDPASGAEQFHISFIVGVEE